MIGASAGLNFRYVGFERNDVGRSARAAWIAASTSRAAPSMLRSMPNCSVIRVVPTPLSEVISVTSEITPRRRSKGSATVAAMVSGLAPAMLACTWMVGKETGGSGATGSL